MIQDYKDQIVDTPLAHKLYDMLMPLLEGEDHVLCLMAHVHNDNKVKKMIDIINAGETNSNYLKLASIDIYDGRI